MKQIQSNSFIYIDERTNGSKTIPYQVRFEIDNSNLQTIIQAKKNKCSLYFSSEALTNLRYYALLSYKSTRSPLVFITNYSQDRETTAIVKSTIYLEGQITQQIRKDISKHPQLFRNLLKSHHWLIFQTLDRLHLKNPKFNKWLLSIVFLLVIVPISLLFICFLFTFNLIKIIVAVFSWSLLYAIADFLLKYKLPVWIQDRLFEGFFAKSTRARKIGINLLSLVSNR